jgi:hypothetical protein
LSQGAYAKRIVEKAGLVGCNPCATPMEPRLKLSKNSTAPKVEGTMYISTIGNLRYLVNTRPNLAFSVGYVSRFLERPTQEHLAVVKRIVRYVAWPVHYGCQYGRNEDWKLVGYGDSDLIGDMDSSKSTTGVAHFLGENLISWQSQKQKVVVLSTSEAECMAVSVVACQGVWLARLLGDLRSIVVEGC